MNRYLKDALFGAIGGIVGTFLIRNVIGALWKRAATRRPVRTNPELRRVS